MVRMVQRQDCVPQRVHAQEMQNLLLLGIDLLIPAPGCKLPDFGSNVQGGIKWPGSVPGRQALSYLLQVPQLRNKPTFPSALQAELLVNAQTVRIKVPKMDPYALFGQTA